MHVLHILADYFGVIAVAVVAATDVGGVARVDVGGDVGPTPAVSRGLMRPPYRRLMAWRRLVHR